MTLTYFNSLHALCKALGLKTLAEVKDYANGNGIIFQNEPICINGIKATDEDLAELIKRIILGKDFATTFQCKGFTYIRTREV